MIYIEDDHQDRLVKDSDFSMEIKGDPTVLSAELAMVLHTLHHIDANIVRYSIKCFWEEVKNDSCTE